MARGSLIFIAVEKLCTSKENSSNVKKCMHGGIKKGKKMEDKLWKKPASTDK